MEIISLCDPNGCGAEGNPAFAWQKHERLLKNASSRKHGPKRTPRKDVHVKVRDLLTGVQAGVREKAVAAFDQARIAGHLSDGAHEAGDLRH
jgi:hypothetical protein